METNTTEKLTSTEIRHRMMQLKYAIEDQENMLVHDVKELYYKLRPSTIIKNAVKDLSADREFKKDAMKETLTFGSSFLLDKVMLSRGSGLKKYLLNMGLKKLAAYFIAKKSASATEQHAS